MGRPALPSDSQGAHWKISKSCCRGAFAEAEADIRKLLETNKEDLDSYNLLHIIRAKRGLADDPGYASLKPNRPPTLWRMVIADLYRGRQTLEQVEAAMKAARSDPLQTGNWPCHAHFYLGEYRLEHGDIAGAKAEFGLYTAATCANGVMAAGLEDNKRLPPN